MRIKVSHVLSTIVVLFILVLFYILYDYVGTVLVRMSYKAVYAASRTVSITLSSFLIWLLSLDYGRFIGRVVRFVWVLILYFTFTLIGERKQIAQTIFFPSSPIFSFFAKGMGWGAASLLASFILTLGLKAITITTFSFNFTTILGSVILYGFGMIMTAASEELVYRGYLLPRLARVIGPQSAVFGISALFGLIHVWSTGLWLYGVSSFVAGIWLSYMFLLYNIYYAIGMHFAWNFLESLIYSNSAFTITIIDPFLAGPRSTPDQEGLISALVTLGILLVWLIVNKNLFLKLKNPIK